MTANIILEAGLARCPLFENPHLINRTTTTRT